MPNISKNAMLKLFFTTLSSNYNTNFMLIWYIFSQIQNCVLLIFFSEQKEKIAKKIGTIFY